MKSILRSIFELSKRELKQIIHTPIYLFCMVLFPIVIIIFFTSLMADGQPTNMPCGIVDNDNSAISRSLIRNLDAFQNTAVVAKYPNSYEARKAIQRNEIYAYLYIPEGMERELVAGRQPTVSFYYSNITMMAGSMLFRDIKTVTTLGGAGVGAAKMQMLGKTPTEIKTILQPITLDVHLLGNPWLSYNIYLSTIMIPGILIIFILLITVYAVGTELKFGRQKEWLALANDNILVALVGKFLPHFLIYSTIFVAYMYYIYGCLNFPHPGGAANILTLTFLAIVSAQGLGIFFFGLIPSLRMAMSISSLWGVLGLSLCGATFPIFAMSPALESLAILFPLRHYYMIYQMCVLNGYALSTAWWYIAILVVFAFLPLLTMFNLKKAMHHFEYIP